ncbi:FHA domain protein [Enhygromyxa salina]|uniref:FHA domain protein n=1 Tax=Enhygromyxa salina TaxID=215803 RepID=A0A2S9YHQ7_9BACT|nr:FHA domain-containing protein [Enhygromyxa salina]PRQ04643.1 FHA domain protein [Enhygromyxa salina]
MATLRHLASNAEHPLSSRHLIGRAPACQLRVDDPGISGYHAELVWDGERWSVQDLGSRNGTTLAGRALARGEQVPLPCKVELVLAGVVRLELIDDSPPQLFAQASNGEVRVAADELLSLPSDDAPELAIYRELDGRWWVELDAETRELAELDTLIAGGRSWQVFSPGSLALTREVGGDLLLAQHELRFRVSRDGEHVELELVSEARAITVEPRVHLALLLVLARARLGDAANPELPEAEHGWVYREDLPRMLGVEPELINLWIHRARRQLARAKIRDAAALIERRAGTSQMRIGATRLRVEDR